MQPTLCCGVWDVFNSTHLGWKGLNCVASLLSDNVIHIIAMSFSVDMMNFELLLYFSLGKFLPFQSYFSPQLQSFRWTFSQNSFFTATSDFLVPKSSWEKSWSFEWSLLVSFNYYHGRIPINVNEQEQNRYTVCFCLGSCCLGTIQVVLSSCWKPDFCWSQVQFDRETEANSQELISYFFDNKAVDPYFVMRMLFRQMYGSFTV